MPVTLYDKHRPKDLDDVIGQPAAVKLLRQWVKDDAVPHAVLFTGPTGCGKTTLAYILADAVGLRRDIELKDVDCGTCEPLDTVKQIGQQCASRSGPLFGKRQGWLLDEAQSLSRAPFAQQGLLKTLEKLPSWAYFFLSTTDPTKLIPTLRNGRCVEVKLKALTEGDLSGLVMNVCVREKAKVHKDVVAKIVECAGGCARQAITLLEKVLPLESDKDRLAELERQAGVGTGFELAQLLFKGARWKDVADCLKRLQDEDIEAARRVVLGYARSVLLNAGASDKGLLAATIIQRFRDATYEGGHAVLCVMAFDVCHPPK